MKTAAKSRTEPAMRVSRWVLALATGGCLTVRLAAAEVPAIEVRPHNGRPMVFVGGQPQALPAYSPSWNAGLYSQSLPRFYPHKMGLYYISVPSMYGADIFWNGDTIATEPAGAAPDAYKAIDEAALRTLAGDPGAHFIIRFFTHEPANWARLHPDQRFVTDDGTVLPHPSLASDVFWSAGAELCCKMIRCYEARPWADRIIGYANFHRNEGVHEPVMKGWIFDHSPVMTARWRAYVRGKYKTEERLRAAHLNPGLTFETVDVPTDKLRGPHRKAVGQLYWQAPGENQPLRDYLELQRELFHQRFRQLCEAMHTATPRKVLFLHDALKQTMQGWNIQEFFDMAESTDFGAPDLNAGSGSMAVAPLLDLPGCDGLITPHDYQLRGMGGIFEPEGIADSVILRGKLFACEMDIRTYANPNNPADGTNYGGARNLAEFEALTWRNLATALTRGFQLYWMDLRSDWFADQAMHSVIERQVQVLRDSVAWPHGTVPGIAMIIDDSAVLETSGASAYLNEAVMTELKTGLSRCGVPYRVYLFDDLALSQFPPHRVFYFPNLFRVDEAKLALLKRRVFRDGNVVVWGPGSGISDGTAISAASVQRLTGFACTLIPANFPHRAMVSNFDHPVTRGLKADTILGGPLPYGPLVFPVDGTPLASAWTKQHLNRVGLAVKEFGKGARSAVADTETLGAGDYAAVFTTAVPLPADLWRNLARYAGAHVYLESNDILLADSSIVAVHSLQCGRKDILLPAPCAVYDVITGQRVGERTRRIEFQMEKPGTHVFRLECDHGAVIVARPR